MPHVCVFQQLAGSDDYEAASLDRKPGQDDDGVKVFHVVDVPDEIKAESLKAALGSTPFASPRYVIPYCLLGLWPPGKSSGGTLLSLADIAALSGLARDSIRKFIIRRQIPATKIGRDWFVHEADFVWWRSRKSGPGRPARKSGR